MDWAFDMPQKTKYLSSKEKRQILNRYNDKKGEEEDHLHQRPILVVFLGMCSDETEMYAQNTVMDARDKGYHPVLVQYRGASGVEFTSPMTYGCG